MYIKLPNRYPYSLAELKYDNPNISFPDSISEELLAKFNVFKVEYSTLPTYNELEEYIVEELPKKIDEKFYQYWTLKPLDNIDKEKVIKDFNLAVKDYLDTFAQSRGYDSMLSLCSYHGSPNPVYNREGGYGLEARDKVWEAAERIVEEFKNGSRRLTKDFKSIIETDLPKLVWPE